MEQYQIIKSDFNETQNYQLTRSNQEPQGGYTLPVVVSELNNLVGSEPQSEDQLVQTVSKLWNYKEGTKLATYYLIGKVINDYRSKKIYGDSEMAKLADFIAVNISNLYKACQFAERYTDEQVRQLLSGSFVMSWRNIAQNLAVPCETILELYWQSQTSGEFCNAVTKLKDEWSQSGNESKDHEQLEGDETDSIIAGGDAAVSEQVLNDGPQETTGSGEDQSMSASDGAETGDPNPENGLARPEVEVSETPESPNPDSEPAGESHSDGEDEQEAPTVDGSLLESGTDGGDALQSSKDDSQTPNVTEPGGEASPEDNHDDDIEALKVKLADLEKAISAKERLVDELQRENDELRAENIKLQDRNDYLTRQLEEQGYRPFLTGEDGVGDQSAHATVS